MQASLLTKALRTCLLESSETSVQEGTAMAVHMRRMFGSTRVFFLVTSCLCSIARCLPVINRFV